MKTIFMTGATGVLGSALVPRLLEDTGTQVRLLIRANSEDHLRCRLRELFDFWGWRTPDVTLEGRLRAFRGDVCLPQLGLSAKTYHQLASDVTHVIHAASNVKLNQPAEEARRNTVFPVKEIVAFCRDCRSFEKLEYLSTVGVAGRMPGLIPERPLIEPRRFRNTYEQAKAEAEDFILTEIRQGLPATIHRPSMVVGDSRTGKIIRFQVFYYLCDFLSGRRTAGFVPELGDATLDIVPVDYVAQAIRVSLERDDNLGQVFHLCSGPQNPLPLKGLSEQVRKALVHHGARLPPLRIIPSGWFFHITRACKLVARGRTRNALRTLPYLLAYLNERQTFTDRRTRSYFESCQPPLVKPLIDIDVQLTNWLGARFRCEGKRSPTAATG